MKATTLGIRTNKAWKPNILSRTLHLINNLNTSVV
jgi:hypothetical protein